jgi:hypothetical protein
MAVVRTPPGNFAVPVKGLGLSGENAVRRPPNGRHLLRRRAILGANTKALFDIVLNDLLEFI